jgi:hypothetical protein
LYAAGKKTTHMLFGRPYPSLAIPDLGLTTKQSRSLQQLQAQDPLTRKPCQSFLGMLCSPPAKRRLQGKQAPMFATAVATAAVLMQAAAAGATVWAPDFLAAEELSPEDADRRKAVYLVTFPHPRALAGGVGGLRAPETLTHKQLFNIILDVFANPDYVDPRNQRRATAGVSLSRVSVFRELHKPVDG